MAENNPHLPETQVNGPGHETGDVNVWAIGKFAIALVGIIAVSLMLLVGLFKYFQTREEANPTAVSVDVPKLFPEPRLQRTPIPDLRTIRADEDRMLNSYGWVDSRKNVVRVPIDVAIDILARKGLPARAQGGAKP